MMRLCHLLTATLLLCIASANAQEVTFSAPGGFYDNPFELTLSCTQQDKVIHYTTHGNMPTANDPVYQGPLLLDKRLYSRSDIYTIVESPDSIWYQPDSVQKCIVVRAAAFNEAGVRIGNVTTNTYLIKSLGCDTHGLPVMSLCADSLELFDYERGIMVPGVHFDASDPDHTGNYYQSGREWERLCNVEYYESGNHGINQQAGLRTHGLSTRRFPQKGLKIYAREEYGKKRFKYKFFDDTNIASFKHLKIKPFESGWQSIGCQDYITGRIARQLNIDCLASRPMVLFINGEYWGIYYLQEKPDERYLEDHYDADLNTVNIIEAWTGNNVEYGSNEAYMDLYNWIQDHDLSDDDNYQYVCANIDIDNFVDYIAFETFIANLDWPANNVRCWQADNSLWRWLFFDGDACLFRPLSAYDPFYYATYNEDDLYYPTNKYSTLVFRRLLENETFKTRFVSRYYQLLSTTFRYESTKPFYDETYALISEEIDNQSRRFGNPESKEFWENEMARIDNFLSHRVLDIDNAICNHFITTSPQLNFADVYHDGTEHVIHLKVESEEIAKACFRVFDIMGRHYITATRILAVGKNEIDIPFESNPGIYIIVSGAKAGKFIVTN